MAEADSMKLDGPQRAALFFLTIGQDRAAEVLKHMSPKEVQQIGAAMAELRNITMPMVEDVLGKFVDDIRNQTALGINSEEYIRNLLTQALGADKASSVCDRILLGRNSKGLEQLKWMDPRAVADLIRLEHPQVIAIILSLLDSDQAAETLSHLPEKLRPDVIMRIATLTGVQPAALRELDDIMEKQLSGNTNVKSSTLGGIETAANILNFIESNVEASIMDQISDIDPDLSQKIQDKMFVFDDLIDVDDRGIQTLLREVSTDSLLLALRGADDALKEKSSAICRAGRRRCCAMIWRPRLRRASEVEAAQKEILAIARRMAEAGELSLGGGGDELI